MTKYEWEHELKKNIHRLPSDEIARVLDYYNEMFEDNIERGKSEREIIHEFGNPVDVADKILSEYEGELLPIEGNDDASFVAPPPLNNSSENDNKTADGVFAGYEDNAPHSSVSDKSAKDGKSEKKENESDDHDKLDEVSKRNLKVSLFLIFNIVTGFALVIGAAVLWIVLASFTVAGVGISVGGVYAVILSFGPLFTGATGSGLAQLGIGLALAGLGVLAVMACIKLILVYAKTSKKIFVGIFMVNKEERK